jgi:hypothetical protein
VIKREELTNPKSCMSRAADDEMTFVLLGRDKAAPVAIRAWVNERIRLGKNTATDPQIVEALACADSMSPPSAPAVASEGNLGGDDMPCIRSEAYGVSEKRCGCAKCRVMLTPPAPSQGERVNFVVRGEGRIVDQDNYYVTIRHASIGPINEANVMRVCDECGSAYRTGDGHQCISSTSITYAPPADKSASAEPPSNTPLDSLCIALNDPRWREESTLLARETADLARKNAWELIVKLDAQDASASAEDSK